MSENLKNKSIKAIVWSSLDKFISQLLYTIVGLYLAAILFPEEFGIVAIPLAICVFINIFTDSGFNTALVQRKNVQDKDYNTVFVFNLFVSITLYIILFFLSPILGRYYGNSDMIMLSRVIFLIIIIQSFGIVQGSKLVRAMNFKAIAIANIAPLSIASITALIMAKNGYGIWCLAAQQVLFVFFRTILYWVQSPWRPKFEFSKSSIKNLYKVGAGIFLTSFIATFFQQIYTFIIGKMTLNDLGYYNRAENWSKIGFTTVGFSVSQALFPALSAIQDEEDRMKKVYEKFNKMLAYLTFPILLGMIIAAKPAFRIIFDNKWDPSVFIFQLLVFKSIFYSFTIQVNQYFMAKGKTKYILFLEIIKDIAIIIAIIITYKMGIVALVWGQVIAGIFHYSVSVFTLDKIIGYSVLKHFKNILPYFAISATIGIILVFIPRFINNYIAILLLQVTIGIGLYVFINYILKSKVQEDTFNTIKKGLNKYFVKG